MKEIYRGMYIWKKEKQYENLTEFENLLWILFLQ